MVGAKEKKDRRGNFHMFKRLASHNPPVYDYAPNPKAFKDLIRGMEMLFDALECPEKWRVGFAVFYLRDEANLWRATVQERHYEPGFDCRKFK